jgi:murein DD-endopeptidase MepM/ murein hydrolase activator NlpD
MEFLKSIGVGGASMGDLTSPLSGPITSDFGNRIHPITGEEKFHAGIDIGASEGTPVGAAGAGEVTMAGWNGGYGNCVMIDHGNGLESLYGHLSAIMVSVGDLVTQLQTIGLVGSTGDSTGPHLHFELRQDGTPIDPSALFGFDIGTRYVPRDMVAMIHEGEMIVPKKENPYANSGGSITGGLGQGITQNVHIYAPTSLSPAQISKQSKRAMRDLVLSL